MGTRRSRHHKGRKPLYKEHRLAAADLIANPPFREFHGGGHYWLNTGRNWTVADKESLAVLAGADVAVEKAADALGRSPTSIAHYAREIKVSIPSDWNALISRYKPKVRAEKAIALAFPYILKPRPEHADLLEVNGLIPRGIPSHMRADMVQEIMLALFDGRMSMEALRAHKDNTTFFIRKFYQDNFEDRGRAISLDQTGSDDRSFYEVASSIAAKEWRLGQFNEIARARSSFDRVASATQFDEVFESQIRAIHQRRVESGRLDTYAEVRAEFDE